METMEKRLQYAVRKLTIPLLIKLDRELKKKGEKPGEKLAGLDFLDPIVSGDRVSV